MVMAPLLGRQCRLGRFGGGGLGMMRIFGPDCGTEQLQRGGEYQGTNKFLDELLSKVEDKPTPVALSHQ